MVRFALAGMVNTAVDFGTFYLLTTHLGLNVYLSHAAGFCLATANGYVLSRVWTFKMARKWSPGEFSRFLTVTLSCLGISSLGLGLFHYRLGLPKMPAKALTAVITIPANFLGQRLWVFTDRRRMPQDKAAG